MRILSGRNEDASIWLELKLSGRSLPSKGLEWSSHEHNYVFGCFLACSAHQTCSRALKSNRAVVCNLPLFSIGCDEKVVVSHVYESCHNLPSISSLAFPIRCNANNGSCRTYCRCTECFAVFQWSWDDCLPRHLVHALRLTCEPLTTNKVSALVVLFQRPMI